MFETPDTENPLLKRELQEIPVRKLPFLMNISGHDVEVNVEYRIEPEQIIGTCSECYAENKPLFREKISGEVKVTSDDKEVVRVAREKTRELVEGVENEMLCCENCFTEEFIKVRPGKYLQAMQSVSQGLGMTIDMQKLESAILNT